MERYKRLISGGRKELEEQLAVALTCKDALLNSLERYQSALACHEEAIEIRKRIILGSIS